MDPVTLSIILQAKNEGLDAINDVSRKLMDLRQEASMTAVTLIQMSGQLKDLIDYAAVTKVMMGQLVGAMNDLKDAVADTNSKLDRLIVTTELAAAASMNLATATAASAASSNAAGVAANTAAAGFLGMGTAMAVVVVGLVSIAAVLSPVLLMLVGAIVILAAFAAGVVAVSAALALAFGPLALLSAGVVMLAERVFTSGVSSVDVLGKFQTKIGDIADAWGVKAAPMALRMMDFFTGLLGPVEKAGETVLTWFGGNLPTILQIAGFAVNVFEGAFQTLATFFTGFFAAMKDHLPLFEQFFALLVQVGVSAIIGLVENLLKLSDWFLQRLPAMAPIVASVMENIGKFIQGAGKVAGDVVDWFIKNWPEIERTAQQTWDSLKAGWDSVAPVLQQLLPLAVQALIGLWQTLHDHSDQLRLVLVLLGGIFGIVAGLILIAVAVTAGLIATVIEVIGWVQQFVNWVTSLVGDLGDWADKTQVLQRVMELQIATVNLLGTALRNLPGLLTGNVAAVSQLAGAFNAAAGAAERLWAAVTHTANAPSGAWQGPTAPGVAPGTSAFPTAQHGGMVPGLVGAPQMIMAHGGEAVLSTDQLDMMISLLSQLVDNTTPSSPFVTASWGRG
jgi:hypothetical protein